MIAGPALALLLISLSAGGEEVDIGSFDKPERSKLEVQTELLEQRVAKPVPSAPRLEIARGDTVFVELELPLKREPRGRLEATMVRVRAPREVDIPAFVEILPSKSSRTARVLYAVRMSPRAAGASYGVFASLEVHEDGVEKPIAVAPIEHTLTAKAAAPTLEGVELDRQAYLFHQSVAFEAYSALPGLRDILRLDRVDPLPPKSRLKPSDLPIIERFARARLRADVARVRLRVAVDGSDPDLSEQAIRAIGSLSKRPTGPAAKARIIEGLRAGRALDLAREALLDVRLDEAEGILNVLRQRGGMTPAELTQVLIYLSSVYAARGRTEDAIASAGRALCISPMVDIQLERPLFMTGLERAKTSTTRCRRPVAIQSVSAFRRVAKSGNELVIRVTYGPDPFGLVEGGEVEFWGAGGAVSRTEKVRSNNGNIECVVPDDGQLENYGGQLLLKVYARELAGVAVATFGNPDPAAIVIQRYDEQFHLDFPWWVWAIAGGVAAVGAATAVGVAVGNRDTKYGIGPVRAEF